MTGKAEHFQEAFLTRRTWFYKLGILGQCLFIKILNSYHFQETKNHFFDQPSPIKKERYICIVMNRLINDKININNAYHSFLRPLYF